MLLRIVKSPSNSITLSNRVAVPEGLQSKYVKLNEKFIFKARIEECMEEGTIGLGGPQRDWINSAIGESVSVIPVCNNDVDSCIYEIVVELGFYHGHKKRHPPLDTEKLSDVFKNAYMGNPFSFGQLFVMQPDQSTHQMLWCKVIHITFVNPDVMAIDYSHKGTDSKGNQCNEGYVTQNTSVKFKPQQNSTMQLVGKYRVFKETAVINPDFSILNIGVGGLNKEFSMIFRRVFTSRIVPREFFDKLGIKHVKGLLLYGPPGTGKTLLARKMCEMINAKSVKIVNGPDVLSKYVGESEANIRKLFAEAEIEQAERGSASDLHVVIFDEIDAICKQRGTVSGATGVHDTIVNQLLTKMDGISELHNIVVIGMTNRRDLIDEALLRPGRFEVQVEIPLPDKHGRLEVLHIHTTKLKEMGVIDSSVDFHDLAEQTVNYSGAELEALVNSAASKAMNSLVKMESVATSTDLEHWNKIKVTKQHFDEAFLEVKPAFGVNADEIRKSIGCGGIIEWSPAITEILETSQKIITNLLIAKFASVSSILIYGDKGCGKTSLAAHLALRCPVPLILTTNAFNLVGSTEVSKCRTLQMIFDKAYKSPESCIIIDDIDILLDYVNVGHVQFSAMVLHALKTLIGRQPPDNHKLLMIGTTSNFHGIDSLGLAPFFSFKFGLPFLTKAMEFLTVAKELGCNEDDQIKTCEQFMPDLQSVNLSIKTAVQLIESVIADPGGGLSVPNKFMNSLHTK